MTKPSPEDEVREIAERLVRVVYERGGDAPQGWSGGFGVYIGKELFSSTGHKSLAEEDADRLRAILSKPLREAQRLATKRAVRLATEFVWQQRGYIAGIVTTKTGLAQGIARAVEEGSKGK